MCIDLLNESLYCSTEKKSIFHSIKVLAVEILGAVPTIKAHLNVIAT